MHYYPHHIGDFTRETAQLTDRQAMSYLRLIWLYYETESPLSDRPDLLAFKIGGDEKEVALILESYFKRDGEQWRHSRCDKEIEAYQKRSIASKKGASARWSNAGAKPEHSNRSADATKTDANQEPRTNNQEPVEKKKRSASAAPVVRPQEVSETIWTDFLTIRKAKRAPLTETAMDGIRHEAQKAGIGLSDALSICCARGWQSFKAEWMDGNRSTASATSRVVPPRIIETFRERDERLARKTYEQITGKPHPDNVREQQGHVIDVTPNVPFLEVGQ